MALRRVTIPLSCNYRNFAQSLSSEISEPGLLPKDKKLFMGLIKDDSFKIWQNKMLRGFEAIVYGRYVSQDGKGLLRLFIRIPLPAVVITIIWYAYILFQIIASNYDSIFFLFISLIAPIVLCFYSFYPDCKFIETKLIEIMNKSESPE